MRGCIILLTCAAVTMAAVTELSLIMDPDDKFKVTWSFEGTKASDNVTFTVECETTGWVGLGLSPNGAMTGADIVVAWVDSAGDAYIKDMHATANGLPTLDTSQDVELVSASEQSGKTTFTFKRKINSCDQNDNPIKESTTRLIYAYGSADPTNNVLASGDYHNSNRGSRSIYMLDPAPAKATSLPGDTIDFDLRIDDYEISTEQTTYYCKFFAPPAVNSKHHIVAAEPIIHAGNEAIVHHIVVYACWGVENERLVNNNKTEGVCFTQEMPEFFDSCRSIVFAWAIGGTNYYFPDNTGFPIGTDDAPQYYMTETHYDNPQGLSGVKDYSGLRFKYTPTLRGTDSGMVEIGNIYGLFIPPQADDFSISAYCHSSCTRQWIPAEGVYFFGYVLHAHLLGTAIKVEQYRDGKSIGIFATDDAYDFNFQEQRSFKQQKKVMPGDTLKITCTFKSFRDSLTVGGLGTPEEMCLAFLSYYPKQSVSYCESIPGWIASADDGLWSSLGITAISGRNSVNYEESLRQVSDWGAAQINTAQQSIQTTTHYSRCVQVGGEDYPADQYSPISNADFPHTVVNDDPCVGGTGGPGDNSAITTSISTIFCTLIVVMCALLLQ